MCSSDMPGVGITSNRGTSVRGATPISSWHSRRAASAHIFAALDPPRRHLDQIALAQREMGAEAKLADQHDFVAVEIDRQDHHDPSDPHGIASHRRAVQLHAIAFIPMDAAAEIFRPGELDLDRASERSESLMQVPIARAGSRSLRDHGFGRGLEIEGRGEQGAGVSALGRT